MLVLSFMVVQASRKTGIGKCKVSGNKMKRVVLIQNNELCVLCLYQPSERLISHLVIV